MINKQFIPWIKDRKINLLQIQTTSSCNGKCIICPYVGSWHQKNPGYMSDSLYKRILNDIAEYEPNFTGKYCPYLMNEPYADKKVLNRCELVYETLYDPFVEISSNMELLNENIIDDTYDIFKQHNFYGKFAISHHGVDKVSFENTMGIDYKSCLNNMIYLLKKFDGKMNISIQDISYSLDKKFSVNPHRKVMRYIDNIIKENKINTNNLIVEPKVFHNRAGNVKIDKWDYNRIVRKIDINNKFDCLRIHGCFHILYTGEVCGCCMDYHREVILGDLSKQTIREIIESEKWNEWINMVNGNIESPDDFICKRCMSPGG